MLSKNLAENNGSIALVFNAVKRIKISLKAYLLRKNYYAF